VLKYIEKCAGTNHNGPAWIAYVKMSKTGRSVYFNGLTLRQSKKGGYIGNFFDTETGEEYWVSGIKKNGNDRHWAGSGPITIEAAAVDDYLKLRGLSQLNPKQFKISSEFQHSDVAKNHARENEKWNE